MATPAANQLEQVISDKFPGTRFGRYNCRPISGSSTWSQHSWNNGRDIYPPKEISYADNREEYQAFLDEVNQFITENFEALNIRIRLWRVKNHYNHIHVDFWPRGWSAPPCTGSASRYKYPDGHEEPIARLLNKYTGEEVMPREVFEGLIRALFAAGGEFQGEPEYWISLIDYPDSPEWENFWAAFTRSIA